MKTSWLGLFLVPCAGLLAFACGEDTGRVDEPGSGGSGGSSGAGGSSGSSGSGGMQGTGVPYTPAGCGYSVDVPAVEEATQDLASEVGSEPAPANIHVSWASETSSSFVVNWRTGLDTKATQVLYGTDKAKVDAADGATDGVTLQRGHNMVIGSALFTDQKRRIHETHLCGLTPETTYYYKAGSPGNWSATYDVATAPPVGDTKPFRFAVTGDSRNEPAVWAETQQKVVGEAPDFQVFSGDAVNIGEAPDQWDGFFGATTGSFAAQESLARIPFMPANGNHDNLTVSYVGLFALPQQVSGSERAQGEEWYSFDYAAVHFVVLNDTAASNILQAQADWMRQDLAGVDRSKTPWVFAMHHSPIYSCSNHGSDKGLRAAWQPVFDQFNVDFVLAGHDHNYERSVPIRGFQTGSDEGLEATSGANKTPVNESGTLYVVAAGAGAPLYASGQCYHTYQSESTRNYVIFDIEARKLTMRAMRLDGSQIETFTITK